MDVSDAILMMKMDIRKLKVVAFGENGMWKMKVRTLEEFGENKLWFSWMY